MKDLATVRQWLEEQRLFVRRGALERMPPAKRRDYVLALLDGQLRLVEMAAASQPITTGS